MIRFGSVCSGIEAASCAWQPLGWRAAFLSEIEAFPRAVLAHHHADTPLHGDFTTIQAGQYEPIDLLVGGTPCQSFSVAGLRGGLADERGNLALEYLRLADRLRPRWLVWENVPGVLSSGAGRDFGSFLGGLVQLGYGFAYRVLDAQFFGLAQRRKRVFVVGYLGDWRRAAAVLFEPASLRWNPAPSREAGKVAANALTERPDRGGGNSEGQRLIANPLGAKRDGGWRGDLDNDTYVANTLTNHHGRLDGDASEDGAERGTPLVACGVTIHGTDKTARVASMTDVAGALRARPPGGQENSSTTAVLAFQSKASASQSMVPNTIAPGLDVGKSDGMACQIGSAVRRLTPRECERLQGFPDDYTLIPLPLKKRQSRVRWAADGPRYRALGNSMAVPVMAWVGRRIATQEAERIAA